MRSTNSLVWITNPGQVLLQVMAKQYRDGFCIFIDTHCQGATPTVSDDKGYVVFDTELEAQRDIAEAQLLRIQVFLDGMRDFEDAISIAEYIVPVTIGGDGSIADDDGNCFYLSVE